MVLDGGYYRCLYRGRLTEDVRLGHANSCGYIVVEVTEFLSTSEWLMRLGTVPPGSVMRKCCDVLPFCRIIGRDAFLSPPCGH